MRKVLCLLLSLCLSAVFVISATADVIWEPYGDSFYEEHRDEIQYENRYYKATSDLAYYKAPNGKIKEDRVIYADELFNVQYVYEDENGALWGNAYVPGMDSVWVLLDGCVRPYDRSDFENDYADQFVAVESQPDISFYADDVPLYDYPGAASSLYNMIVDEGTGDLPVYAHAYVDEAGNVWGELTYFRGLSGWVLLEGDIATAKAPEKERDFPIGTTEPAATDPTEAETNETESEQDTLSEENTETVTTVEVAEPVAKQNMVVPVLLVAAVAAVTLAVLFIFFRKKK